MNNIAGINYIKKDKYSIFWIENLTDEIKDLIRQQLSEICYGEDNANSGRDTYNYINTVKEFVVRYESKSPNIQIGMIGELLVHLLVRNFFDEYRPVTPFFNLVERSIKKGYDLVLTEKNKPILWIIEVKSGELHSNSSSDQSISDLLGTAQGDLDKRLNNENLSLWSEAVNSAKISFDSNDVMKKAVVDLLMDWQDDASNGIYTSTDKNVFLSGVLFYGFTDPITERNILRKQTFIETQNKFNKVYVLAVQKETYTKVYEFFKNEANI